MRLICYLEQSINQSTNQSMGFVVLVLTVFHRLEMIWDESIMIKSPVTFVQFSERLVY